MTITSQRPHRHYNLRLKISTSRKKDAETLLDPYFHGKSVSFRSILVQPQRTGATVIADVDLAARYPADVRNAAQRVARVATHRTSGTIKLVALDVQEI